jgi:pimeloyl-ACP methyl ester carboxylesterase
MQKTGKDLTILVNDISICYDDEGTSGKPIVFIHGFPFSKSSWNPQMEYMRKTNRVISYDLRGFGQSSAGDQEISIALLADDLIGLLKALDIKSAIVCGLSMGGYIILNAVKRYPEMFEAIVLSDTQCIADSDEVREKRQKTIQLIHSGGIHEFTEAFIKSVFYAQTLQDNPAMVEAIKNTILNTAPSTLKSALNALAQRSETCTTLSEMDVPTLIICGMEDKVTPLAQSEFLHTNIRPSILHAIEEAGHLSNLEQQDVFNEHLSNFINNYKTLSIKN